jgi:DNA-binding transcriptional LysR family regulator
MTKGSVIVNGVRFEDTAANIHPDDTGKVFLPADLKDGMTVKVRGEINDDRVTGRALEIEVENEVRGTVNRVGTDTFTVLGQTVFVDGGTVFANVAGIADLVAGTSAVEVHGQRDAAGVIRASRVELLVGPGVVDEVRGVVAGKDASPGAGTFSIGGLSTFTYDAETDIVGVVAFDNGDLVEIHLESTNRRVDVIREGFDLAIRVRFPPLERTDLVMRKLDESRQCLVASPNLLGRRGALANPADLNSMPSLDLGPPRRDHVWRLERVTGESAEITHAPRLITDDMAALRAAAIEGVGVVQLPTLMIFDDIQASRLENVLPDWAPRPGIVHAVFPSRRGLLPSVRALLDFLADQCKAQRQAVGEAPAA